MKFLKPTAWTGAMPFCSHATTCLVSSLETFTAAFFLQQCYSKSLIPPPTDENRAVWCHLLNENVINLFSFFFFRKN